LAQAVSVHDPRLQLPYFLRFVAFTMSRQLYLMTEAEEEGLIQPEVRDVRDLRENKAPSRRFQRIQPFVAAMTLVTLIAGSAMLFAASDSGYHAAEAPTAEAARRAQGVTPSDRMSCIGAVMTTESLSRSQYRNIVRAIQRGLNQLSPQCEGDVCPQADITGCVLRMAGHDFMDYNSETDFGGSDACLDMSHPDNAGLAACLYTGEEFGFSLNSVYQEWCSIVSLADFIVIGAEAVMDFTRNLYRNDFPAAARMNFRGRFRFGRTTATECEASYERLPHPEVCDDVTRVFVNSLGLTWTQAAALMGVHTLGRASTSNSGYDGWWSDPENSRRFNNNYFITMLANGWMPERAVGGNPAKNQWERSNRFFDSASQGKQMMLDTDLCLAFSTGNFNMDGLSAKDHDCCAWAMPFHLVSSDIDVINVHNGGEYCDRDDKTVVDFWKTLPIGEDIINRQIHWDEWELTSGARSGGTFRRMRRECCRGCDRYIEGDCAGFNDCGSVSHPTGHAFQAVKAFSLDEDFFVAQFMTAWRIATSRGHRGLRRMSRT